MTSKERRGVMETSTRRVTHVPPGKGESLWVLGALYTFKVVSEDTNGDFALWEVTLRPGEGAPPPHLHLQEDETFYVLEGELEFMAGNHASKVTPGSFVYIPRNTMHTFRNVGTTPAKLLVSVVPGGFEKFFFKVGEPDMDKSSPPVPEGPPDVEKLVATAAKYNCEIPPPPQAH
jgi:mannose-6-phosphate isomerase-like protein (cupin superfamily)